ncbi:MAG TPA: carbohydrate-binding protein, partial [Polyangiaceae bacterium]
GDNANRVRPVKGHGGGDVAFPSTGGYANYQTVTATATLPAGESALTIAYVSGQGSGGYLNLDEVTLTAK